MGAKVNNFVIVKNPRNNPIEEFVDKKDILVFHPIYDGINLLHDADTQEEAEGWCRTQDFDAWTETLL